MLRRSHKKSYAGCVPCKRRHVKCDERRPVCLLCSMSGRDCSYAATTRNPPSEGRGLNAETPSSEPVSSQDGSSKDAVPPAPSDILNLEHMELLAHAMLDKDVWELTSSGEALHQAAVPVVFEKSLRHPFLLYQLLAFASRHLAAVRPPPRQADHARQAVTFQTRAVSLFISAWAGRTPDRDNCVPVLLFSSVLGHHLLADTLAFAGSEDQGEDPDGFAPGLDAFMARYVHTVEMHRGTRAVASSSWPLLMQSELGPILSWSSGFTSRKPRGRHCWRVAALIEGASWLSDEDRESCRVSLRYLQVGFDAIGVPDVDGGGEMEVDREKEPSPEGYHGNKHQMIFSWTMLVPPRFTGLLAAKRPEVLVLLAYYTVLLHYGRHMWQVGGSGVRVLRMISDYLGPEWDDHLRYPREMIARA